MNQGALSFLKR